MERLAVFPSRLWSSDLQPHQGRDILQLQPQLCILLIISLSVPELIPVLSKSLSQDPSLKYSKNDFSDLFHVSGGIRVVQIPLTLRSHIELEIKISGPNAMQLPAQIPKILSNL